MKRLSTARKLCVLLHDSSFSALPPEQISSSRFSALSVCGPPHAVPSSALRRTASMHLDATFPLLNLHRARAAATRAAPFKSMYRKRARASRLHPHSSVDARFRYITRTYRPSANQQ